MSSATYSLRDMNETISWTYDRLLSNASIEKRDLSLLGFIIGILCIISITTTFLLRILFYTHRQSSLFSSSESSSSPSSYQSSLVSLSTTSTLTENKDVT